jgi:hypothetical protein
MRMGSKRIVMRFTFCVGSFEVVRAVDRAGLQVSGKPGRRCGFIDDFRGWIAHTAAVHRTAERCRVDGSTDPGELTAAVAPLIQRRELTPPVTD